MDVAPTWDRGRSCLRSGPQLSETRVACTYGRTRTHFRSDRQLQVDDLTKPRDSTRTRFDGSRTRPEVIPRALVMPRLGGGSISFLPCVGKHENGHSHCWESDPVSQPGGSELLLHDRNVASSPWWSRVESNHYLRLRRPSSYPLDHGTSRDCAEAGRGIGAGWTWQGEG